MRRRLGQASLIGQRRRRLHFPGQEVAQAHVTDVAGDPRVAAVRADGRSVGMLDRHQMTAGTTSPQPNGPDHPQQSDYGHPRNPDQEHGQDHRADHFHRDHGSLPVIVLRYYGYYIVIRY
jgi:hypothetical protein